MNNISIIIPILNEAETIVNLLTHLLKNSSQELISEIIVVDGGSNDGSQNMVSQFNNVVLLNSKKGRAIQMNVGAKHATGNIFYFLHADSFPPKDFDYAIINEIKKGNHAGCFAMTFNTRHWWLIIAGWFTQFNYKMCRGGDQSLFVTKALFDSIGGFNESFIIYEDNDFVSKIYKRNKFVVIKKWLTTSARRYNKNGVFKLQYHFFVIYLKKWLGASPKNLNAYYKKHIH
jgi:rSAM/selenodomain-associated transferase 2